MRRTNCASYCNFWGSLAALAATNGFPIAALADTAAPKPAHEVAERVTMIQDLQATLTVTQSDTKELDKIGKDFSVVYRLKNIALYYKSADRLRMEGSSRVYGDALLISNGPAVFYAVPRLRIRKTDDLTDAPGRRQSLLELAGVLSPETLKLMRGEFVKCNSLDGKPDGKMTEIYDLKYAGKPTGPRYRVWVDPVTRVTLRREWYDSSNKLRATFAYMEPQEIAPHIWLPAKCEVRNSDGGLAATLTIKDAKINQKLGDDLFEITP